MLKKILLTIGAAAATLGSSLALAHGWRPYHPHYFALRPVIVLPAPRVVYAPPPPVVYPYYAAPGVSIRLSFPL